MEDMYDEQITEAIKRAEDAEKEADKMRIILCDLIDASDYILSPRLQIAKYKLKLDEANSHLDHYKQLLADADKKITKLKHDKKDTVNRAIIKNNDIHEKVFDKIKNTYTKKLYAIKKRAESNEIEYGKELTRKNKEITDLQNSVAKLTARLLNLPQPETKGE